MPTVWMKQPQGWTTERCRKAPSRWLSEQTPIWKLGQDPIPWMGPAQNRENVENILAVNVAELPSLFVCAWRLHIADPNIHFFFNLLTSSTNIPDGWASSSVKAWDISEAICADLELRLICDAVRCTLYDTDMLPFSKSNVWIQTRHLPSRE